MDKLIVREVTFDSFVLNLSFSNNNNFLKPQRMDSVCSAPIPGMHLRGHCFRTWHKKWSGLCCP